MRKTGNTLLLAGLLAALGPGVVTADDGSGPAPRWSVTAAGAVVSPEGGREGYGGMVNLAWRTPYQSPGAPRAYFGLEVELLETTDSFSRDRSSGRIEGDMRSLGLYLAANTYFSERGFYRARLGGVYRYLDESHRDGRHQGRMGFGLGLGYSLSERIDLVGDAGLQYLGQDLRLLYTGTAGIRVHF